MLNYRHISEVWLDTAQQLVSPPRGVFLNQFPRMSSYLGGLRPHELTILCAPTGSGKTQLLANLAAQLAFQGESIFVAPVETGDSDFVTRMLSCLEKRDYNTGQAFEIPQVKSLGEKHAKTILEKNVFLSTYDNRVEVEEMINLLIFLHKIHGVSVAFLDNLNFFLKVVSSQMEKAEMDQAIHQFVMLSKAIPVHIVLIMHPRKTINGRVESEFDIKGSSTAVQEAFNILLFNRPKQEDVQAQRRHRTDRELMFAKIRRNGIRVGESIWLSFSGGRFTEMAI